MALKPRKATFRSEAVEALESLAVEVTPGEPDVIIRRGTLWPADHPVVQKYAESFTDLGQGQLVPPPWVEREEPPS